jgi:hypothetical protein
MPPIQRLDTTRSEGLDVIHGRNLVATALGVPRACARGGQGIAGGQGYQDSPLALPCGGPAAITWSNKGAIT